LSVKDTFAGDGEWEASVARATAKRERLEARISPEQKRLFERAAAVSGRTLTDYVVTTLEAAARQTIHEHDVIRLSPEDSILFVEALLNPPEPNERLRAAWRRHEEFLNRTRPDDESL
jgi:uncharacterized protein (DUF1778 family)